ncbi:LamG domain-containing protein [Coraliomargarita sinensis]|uniref:LamG domain-containing protein n=1 Tax=Coraliomargarita sinensis TaxID=2174842 RepID=UPI001E4C6585|nr:LamG domain-containing protein [Coraliomargarita sinensis]
MKDGETVILLADLLDSPLEGVSFSGEPQRIVDPKVGPAVLFDGVNDAIFVEQNPLAGLTEFTVEIIFRPDAGGSDEPRFFHVGTVSKDRMMVETRNAEGTWALDSFFRHGEDYLVLLDNDKRHPLGEWAHLAIVMNDGVVRNYVNGQLELEGELEFQPIDSGGMSIGVRMNKVHWFKGAIHSIRIKPRTLAPSAFTLR